MDPAVVAAAEMTPKARVPGRRPHEEWPRRPCLCRGGKKGDSGPPAASVRCSAELKKEEAALGAKIRPEEILPRETQG